MGSVHLAGDIGGTKTTLAVIDTGSGPRVFLDKETYPSQEYPSLEAMVTRFLKGKKWAPSLASFGVAGPVINGQVQATNLPWRLAEPVLSKELNMPVRLLNDLTATANSVPFMKEDDLVTLNPGKPVDHGSIAVIAPGTGLGEAYLNWDGTRYRAFPSEGGHVDFAPTDQMQIKMLGYLQAQLGHISYERVCSGIGLPNIYAFLKAEGIETEPAWLHDQLGQEDDPTPVITRAALEGTAKIAVAALDLFSTILAAEAGNLALKILADGGVYLGGGIPPRILPFMQKESFLKAFRNKGRFASFLENIPVHVILNSETALIGAARYGLEVLKNN
jgi:glucokinase